MLKSQKKLCYQIFVDLDGLSWKSHNFIEKITIILVFRIFT